MGSGPGRQSNANLYGISESECANPYGIRGSSWDQGLEGGPMQISTELVRENVQILTELEGQVTPVGSGWMQIRTETVRENVQIPEELGGLLESPFF